MHIGGHGSLAYWCVTAAAASMEQAPDGALSGKDLDRTLLNWTNFEQDILCGDFWWCWLVSGAWSGMQGLGGITDDGDRKNIILSGMTHA